MATDPIPPAGQGAVSSAAGYNARCGLWFFAVYCLMYGGFVALAAFDFQALAQPVGGVNWAILYGMGLIVGAFVLAVLYMYSCRPETAEQEAAGGTR